MIAECQAREGVSFLEEVFWLEECYKLKSVYFLSQIPGLFFFLSDWQNYSAFDCPGSTRAPAKPSNQQQRGTHHHKPDSSLDCRISGKQV
jgi:hypothetical protein